MYRTCNNRLIERQLDREMHSIYDNRQIERQIDRKEEVGTGRCIQYVTIDRQRDSQINNRLIERQLDREMYTLYGNRQIECYLYREEEEEEVGTGRCIQNTTIDRQRVTQIERRRSQVQVDVYNIQQQIDREIVRQRGGGGRYRQMYTTYNNRQIEIQLDREEEEEEVGTGRCIQHKIID